MRRIVLVPLLVLMFVLGTAAPTYAFVHITVPGDDCAAPAADTNGAPGDNLVASQAIPDTVSRPLGGVKNAPTACPAP